MYFGIYTYPMKEIKNFDKMIDNARKVVLSKINLNPFDKFIVTGGYPLGQSQHTNFMKIEEL